VLKGASFPAALIYNFVLIPKPVVAAFRKVSKMNKQVVLYAVSLSLSFLLLMCAVPGATALTASSAPGDEKQSASSREDTIQKVYIVQLTHCDIGFTAPPDDVAEECKARIDQVIGYLHTYPDFKWTIESIWQLEQWLERTDDPAKVAELFDFVSAGRIAVCGGYANMHSSMLGSEEMNRFLYPAQRLRSDHGVTIDTVAMNDVPGWSQAMPQVMSQSGCPYFLTGPNTWLGGAAKIPMAERPFYWEGPDGSRVLTWMGYGHYLEGAFEYSLHGNHTQMEQGLLGKIAEWEAAGYPYDAILVIDGTGDNGMANNVVNVINNVAWWNSTHSIELILATPGEFFRYMEQTYPGSFPVYSGDSAGFWAGTVNCGVPVGQAAARVAGDQVLTGEKLAAIDFLRGGSYPVEEIDGVYHEILNIDEHSGSGVGWPGLLTKAEIDRANLYKFMESARAYRASCSLLDTGLEALGRGSGFSGPAILVFNSLSWERTDPVRVEIPAPLYGSAFIIKDGATQAEIPYQKLGDSTIAFIAESVPALGQKVYYGEAVSTPPVYPDRVFLSGGGTILENDFYIVTADPQGLSIVDKETGRELVNGASEFAFNGLIRANNGDDFIGVHEKLPIGKATISGSSGPVSGELAVDFESLPLTQLRIVLHAGVKRIDLANTMDRSRMRFVPFADHSEHYSLTFPFDLAVSEGAQAGIENPNAVIRPDRDYLPGAYVGNFVSQHAIDLREASGFGVTMANRESFFNEIGGPFHHSSAFDPEEATIVNKVVQKLDQGDTKDQGIVTITSMDNGIQVSRFHYAITTASIPPGSMAAVHTVRFGCSFDLPLEAVFFLGKGEEGGFGDAPAPSESFFSLSRDNVILLAVKKAEFNGDSDVIFRIQEIAGIAATGVKLRSIFPFTHAELCTVVEQAIPGGTLPVDPIVFDIEPHETVTIRAR